MSNSEKFKKTFEKIEMPEEKFREIEALSFTNLSSKKSAFEKKKVYYTPVVVFAAIMAVVIVSGSHLWNQRLQHSGYEMVTGEITYFAAEGEGENDTSLVVEEEEERFRLKKEQVMVNNDRLSESVVDTYLDENGVTYYYMADNSHWGLRIEDPEHTSVFVYEIMTEGGSRGGIVAFCGAIREMDGRIYLDLDQTRNDNDITQDFSDGIATGTFEWSTGSLDEYMRETFEYRVEGTLENYTIDVWWVESEE